MNETQEKTPAQLSYLYKKTIEVKFFPDSHIYYVAGKRASGVTSQISIIDKSRALIGWALDCSADYLRGFVNKKLTEEMIDEAIKQHEIKKGEAAGIGTMAHEWMEAFVKGENPAMPEHPNAAQAVSGFLEWVERNKVKFLESEKIVYSKKHKYVGQMDATATMHGTKKKFVIDYKVSNGLYPGVAYQTAAYCAADEEESGTKYEGRWALRLSKETEDEYYARMEKKRNKWIKENPDRQPYQITPYTPFEAKYLDEYPEHLESDLDGFLTAKKLTDIHRITEKRFFDRG